MKLQGGMADTSDRPRVVIVGAGFAGFYATIQAEATGGGDIRAVPTFDAAA